MRTGVYFGLALASSNLLDFDLSIKSNLNYIKIEFKIIARGNLEKKIKMFENSIKNKEKKFAFLKTKYY